MASSTIAAMQGPQDDELPLGELRGAGHGEVVPGHA